VKPYGTIYWKAADGFAQRINPAEKRAAGRIATDTADAQPLGGAQRHTQTQSHSIDIGKAHFSTF